MAADPTSPVRRGASAGWPARLEELAGLEGIASAFAAARDGIDALLRDRGLRRTDAATTAEALLRGAHASAALDGSASSLAEVRATGGDPTARGAVRVATELLSLVPVLPRSPLQALARLHALAAADSLAPDRVGRPRDAEAATGLRSVADLVLATAPIAGSPRAVPALLVAAVVHAELMAGEPFPSHNGIVARAAERLVLAGRGVDPRSVLVPESGHLALRAAYHSNLRGYREGGDAGAHAWLAYAAEAYAAGAERSPLASA